MCDKLRLVRAFARSIGADVVVRPALPPLEIPRLPRKARRVGKGTVNARRETTYGGLWQGSGQEAS